MSDQDPQSRDLHTAPGVGDPAIRRKETRNIPPLVWIVVVILIALLAVAYFGWGRTLVSPTGAKVPAENSQSVAPASGR